MQIEENPEISLTKFLRKCFCFLCSHDQREGMDLLVYQAMPSLRDVAYDGWLCTFTIKQQLEIPSARSWTAPVRGTGTVRKTEKAGSKARPSHIKSHLPGHSPPASQAGRAAVLGQPSSLWPETSSEQTSSRNLLGMYYGGWGEGLWMFFYMYY
jgi:hypothetical protein